MHLPALDQCVRAGIVVFNAYGVEDLSTRYSFACLAARLAAAGHPVLRFDSPGTGDALEDGGDGDPLPAWVQAGQDAVRALKVWSGVSQVALVGLRLGALVAAQVAHVLNLAGESVCGLALLAPVIQGRQHLRELRALSDGTQPMVVAGFSFGQEIQDALMAANVSAISSPTARVFLAVHGNSKACLQLQAKWGEAADVVRVDYEGLTQHIGNPTTSRPPELLFDQLVGWLGQGGVVAKATVCAAIAPAVLSGPGFVELGALIPAAVGLAAVWCRPVETNVRNTVVIFCNAGRNPHQGWARGTVSMARALAKQGVSSVRFDLAGLGDSPPLPQPPDEVLYSTVAVPQLRAVVDHVCGLVGDQVKICVVGVCSGGYLAFHAAVDDARIGALLLINVQRFVWKEGMSLEAAMRSGGRSMQAYRQRMVSRDTWRRLLRGEVDVAAAVRALTVRVLHGFSADSGDGVQIRRKFSALAKRGCRVAVVYSQEDGGRDEFARYFGLDGRRFTALPCTNLVVLDGADHDLSERAARDNVLEVLKKVTAALPVNC